jgi:hypothetical protein
MVVEPVEVVIMVVALTDLVNGFRVIVDISEGLEEVVM